MGKFAEFNDKEIQKFFKEFVKNSNDSEINAILKEAITKIGNMTVTEVKRNTAIKTGTLSRGWKKTTHVSGTEAVAEIYNNVEYAPFYENGHRIVRDGNTYGYVDGRHVLSNAVDSMEPVVNQIANDALDKIANKLFGGM